MFPQRRRDDETTPLIRKRPPPTAHSLPAVHHHSMLSSPTFHNCSPSDMPEKPPRSTKTLMMQGTPSVQERSGTCCGFKQCFNVISRVFQRNPWCLKRSKYVFEIVLANGLLACIFVLVMKVVDDGAFARWTKGKFATLGNWNLQIADILLVLSYAMTDFLQLRICLSIACISFVIYAMTSPIGIMADMGMFNFVMALLNIRHAVVLIYEKRYIEFPEAMEQVYLALFARYMTRVQFKRLADISVIRTTKANVVMKEEGDLVTSLCIVVNGQVEVRRNGRLLNMLFKNEILEAPEWVRTNLDPEGTRFTVGFVTATDVTYIKFTRELLAAVIQEDRAIRSAVLAVLGIRVSELWLRSLDRKVEQAIAAEQSARRQQLESAQHYTAPGGGGGGYKRNPAPPPGGGSQSHDVQGDEKSPEEQEADSNFAESREVSHHWPQAAEVDPAVSSPGTNGSEVNADFDAEVRALQARPATRNSLRNSAPNRHDSWPAAKHPGSEVESDRALVRALGGGGHLLPSDEEHHLTAGGAAQMRHRDPTDGRGSDSDALVSHPSQPAGPLQMALSQSRHGQTVIELTEDQEVASARRDEHKAADRAL